MSRTLRRKTFATHDIKVYGYLYDEHRILRYWKWSTLSRDEAEIWTRWTTKTTYQDYKKEAISKFHRDGTTHFANYNSAPWWYRNKRNRALRLSHKNECRKVFIDETVEEYDVVLDPFFHNVGWDYW